MTNSGDKKNKDTYTTCGGQRIGKGVERMYKELKEKAEKEKEEKRKK